MTEQRTAQVFVDLAGTLVDGVGAPGFLQDLTERCVELLGLEAATLAVTGDDGRLQLVSGTTRAAWELGFLELRCERGPGPDTFATGEAVLDAPTAGPDAERRWPEFAAAARGTGVRSASALPLRMHRRVVGVLELFSDRPEGIGAAALDLGQALADVAAVGLLHERSAHEVAGLAERLQAASRTRAVLDQAAGVLAARSGIGVEDAFVQLRRYARRHGDTLVDVASAVVAGTVLPGLRGTLPSPARHRAQTPDTAPGAAPLLQPLDLEVLRLISAGTAGEVVALRLRISPSEVTKRLSTARVLLGVGSTAAAVHEARRCGLL